MTLRRATLAWIGLALSSCTAPSHPPVSPPAPHPVSVAPPPPAEAHPPPSHEDPAQRIAAIAAATGIELSEYVSATDAAKLTQAGVTEPLVLLALEAAVEPCLGHQAEPMTASCGDALGALLAEIADASPRSPTPAIRLLVRLEALGLWRADLWMDRLLERRFEASPVACSAPTLAELASAHERAPRWVMQGDGSSHRLSPRERDDLAYALAVVSGSGSEVGTTPEDTSSPPLPTGDPLSTEHRARLEEMLRAEQSGAIERYVELGEADLRAFGYPGPVRVLADGDMRWGGAGLSYEMRGVAELAELAGRRDLAGDLYRRANPGGGACGTSTPSRREDQMTGILRTARDCREVGAELLYAVHAGKAYGPLVLERAGVDVARVYRGLLWTLHASEPWGQRTRAIEGLADVEKGRAIPELFALARHEDPDNQAAALDALGELAETHGGDPCNELIGFGSYSSLLPREITSANLACKTRLSSSQTTALVVGMTPWLRAGSASVRASAARALGKIGDARARAKLEELSAKDPEAGVRDDATEALTALREIAKARSQGP